MRLSTVLLQCCAFLQCAAAKDAYLYTFNDERQNPSTTPTTISADTAFQILARRQGETEILSLQGTDEKTLSQIAQHGGYQQPLFSETVPAEPARVLVRIQVQNTKATQNAQRRPAFKVHKPTQDLLIPGSESLNETDYAFAVSSDEGVRLTYRSRNKSSMPGIKGDLFVSNEKPIIEILQLMRSYLSETSCLLSASLDIDFTDSKISEQVINSQIDLFLSVFRSSMSTLDHQPTLLLLPPTSQLAPSTISLGKREDPEEELLDLVTPLTTVSSSDSTTYKSNVTLPRRFPTCFSSKEACNNGTNSCSGHGTCGPSGSNKKCFQCKCTRTVVRTNKDGTKKTDLWAGAACQKKDISMEFVLFATIGITAMALVAGVIGMMYSMGAQELPSVIGAGVAGTTARK